MGKSCPCPSLKTLSSKVGGIFWQAKYKKLDTKLEKKLIELRGSSSGHENIRSINSIILRFPRFREGLKNIKGVFQQYDEDSNGTIDRDELTKCLKELELHLTDEEVEDLFHSCDVDRSQGIQFNEFIVLLCLIYLLMKPSSLDDATPQLCAPQLEATFDTIVEAFLFLDKNGDGKLNNKDMINTLNDACPWEKSPAHVTRTRIKEIDWDRHGKVGFREFLFAFISWVGFDDDEEML